MLQKFALAATMALPLAGNAAANPVSVLPAAGTGNTMCADARSLGHLWDCMEESMAKVGANETKIFGAWAIAQDRVDATRFTFFDSLSINAYLGRKNIQIEQSCALARAALSDFHASWNKASANIDTLDSTPVPPVVQLHADDFARTSWQCHNRYLETIEYMQYITGGNPHDATAAMRATMREYLIPSMLARTP
jgi:hypothetical protein